LVESFIERLPVPFSLKETKSTGNSGKNYSVDLVGKYDRVKEWERESLTASQTIELEDTIMSNNSTAITVSATATVSTKDNTMNNTALVVVNASDLVRSIGIKDVDLTALAAQVAKSKAAYEAAVAAHASASTMGANQVAEATNLVESLRSLGLNDDAIKGALGVKYANAKVKTHVDRPSEKDGRSMKGEANAQFAAEVRASVSEYIAAASGGFTAAALCTDMLMKHTTKSVEVREYLDTLLKSGEVMFNGAIGRGACWAAPCYAGSLPLFVPKELRGKEGAETPASE
jgi:hypothetical protein